MGSFFSLGKSSNDTQENSKDALKKEEELKKVQEVQEENAKLNRDKTDLTRERDNLNDQLNASQKQVQALEQSQQALKNEKTDLTNKITGLSTEKENLTKDKENLTTVLSIAESQAEQTSQKLNELERKHAPYKKLEKLYEVFLEVKDRLNFNFVATTHSAMDLIAYILSDSKYYLESLYNKASQELSDKKSDKGEKLAELFDLLFEYIKDSKFERLKEPSAYDHSCKTLYPEQNTSQKIQRVVLRGYTYDKKIACYTIVDMGG
ncbi:M protein [Helicobacter pylori]|uniref:M protein n=1 Tax=Helicobacter pylori TaxID=210 RepID=UPI000FDDBE33|nr:M protein [Helicobacter pylori]RVY80575.1 M protein [Helicobacter pylori]